MVKRNRDMARPKPRLGKLPRIDVDRLARTYGEAVAAEVLHQLVKTRVSRLSRG